MRLLLLISLLCGIYFLFAFIAVHMLKKGSSFRNVVLSKYAFGKYGWITSSSFLVTFLEEVLLGIYFISQNYFLPGLCLVLAGSGMLLVAFFKPKERGLKNNVHIFGATMQFFFFPFALLFLFLISRKELFSLLLGSLTLIFSLVMVSLHKRYMQGKQVPYGLVQKINILLIDFWLIVFPLVRLI